MSRDAKTVSEALRACPKCGSRVAVSPEPYRSCFDAKCLDTQCGHAFSYHVRACAFSLPSCFTISGTILCGVAAHLYTRGIPGWIPVFTIILSVFLGGAVLALIFRFAALVLLCTRLPLSWKEELIAYLAPPPFRQGASTGSTEPELGQTSSESDR